MFPTKTTDFSIANTPYQKASGATTIPSGPTPVVVKLTAVGSARP
jgi:hypothetical protein